MLLIETTGLAVKKGALGAFYIKYYFMIFNLFVAGVYCWYTAGIFKFDYTVIW